MRRPLQSMRDYLSDLGVGGWVLILALVVGVGLVVAVVQGRSGPDQQPCDQAAPLVDTISRLSQSGKLSTVEAAQLHEVAGQLTAIARTSSGDDTRALEDAARAAGDATAGRPFDAVQVLDEFSAACPSGGLG